MGYDQQTETIVKEKYIQVITLDRDAATVLIYEAEGTPTTDLNAAGETYHKPLENRAYRATFPQLIQAGAAIGLDVAALLALDKTLRAGCEAFLAEEKAAGRDPWGAR